MNPIKLIINLLRLNIFPMVLGSPISINAVIPAGIAGIQMPRMAMPNNNSNFLRIWSNFFSHPCVLDLGNPCRDDELYRHQKPLIATMLSYFLLILVLIFGIAPHQTFAADISTSVDRNPVSIDESFKIFFTANDTPDSDPDFAPLQQDFAIVNQGQSTSSSWVNGNYTKSIRWTVEVTANKPGNLVIPAIQFGSDASNPLPIVVTQGTATGDAVNTNEEIFLEVKATPEQPYVQSQVIYTVRLYRRVDVAQAELSEPELADAVIEKLSEDSNYNTVVNGVSYLVTERKYAIFPQKSGVMNIKPLSLTAAIIVDRQPDFRDFFGSRMTKTKRVLSKEVTLNVKPAPSSSIGKNWLAAEKLELTQEWSGDSQQMKVGEPLTRTLTLQGVGTTVGQLPELSAIKTDANFKAYPDQPILNEQKLAAGITASRQEKIALIPSIAGKHVLPAIEVPWFNTKTQTMEIARIPETTINVVGISENQPDANALPKPLIPPVQPSTKPETTNPILVNTNAGQQNIWLWASLFLALGWLATLIYFLKRHPKKLSADADDPQRHRYEASLKESIKNLKEACADNDALAAKNALLAWGKQKFSANNLGAIADCCDARLRDEITQLNQILYGKDKNQWVGKKLMQAFTENKAREKKASNDDPILEPLNRL
ncbi:BatD family protein [Methyloglobulus sp.]|uniref:BatD family protein n=1 Tax=Methyloglobulus sp. TaxID=2518622 RepID=UPI0032B778CB